MSIAISFDPDARIVMVKVSGRVSPQDHNAARSEALRLCRENNTQKLLVDLCELNTEESTVMDCFAFGESFPLLSPLACIAHVLPTDEKSKKDVRFTSNVSANRGLLIGDFETVDQARNWLMRLK
jgi:hypothetical protein